MRRLGALSNALRGYRSGSRCRVRVGRGLNGKVNDGRSKRRLRRGDRSMYRRVTSVGLLGRISRCGGRERGVTRGRHGIVYRPEGTPCRFRARQWAHVAPGLV